MVADFSWTDKAIKPFGYSLPDIDNVLYIDLLTQNGTLANDRLNKNSPNPHTSFKFVYVYERDCKTGVVKSEVINVTGNAKIYRKGERPK